MGNNIFGNPELVEDDRVRWKISGPWARKPINCTLHGILNECHGCCIARPGWVAETKYPIRAFGENSKMCGFFEIGKGCKFTLKERPLNCMLYPFVLNPNKTLVISARSLTSSCKHAYKTQEKSLFEIFKDTWVELFGLEEYERVYKDIITDNKDESYFYPSDRLLRIMDVENQRERDNEKPTDRNEIV